MMIPFDGGLCGRERLEQHQLFGVCGRAFLGGGEAFARCGWLPLSVESMSPFPNPVRLSATTIPL